MDEFKSGALIDVRPPEEKERDFLFEETVTAAAPVAWQEKSTDDLRHFEIQNQKSSGSCVAQTLKKMMGVYIWLKTKAYVALSASHIYQRRNNRPYTGMMGIDAFNIGQKGVTLEVFAPSEKLSDTQMDNVNVSPFMVNVGKTFSLGNYLTINQIGVIDVVASIIQETGKAVMIWFYFTQEEWEANRKTGQYGYTIPEVKTNLSGPQDTRSLRHSVAAVDFFMHNGQKALWIEDSAHFGGVPNRIITQDFFEKRNYFGGHFMNFAFEAGAPNDPRPTYVFLRDLEFSPVVDYDQDVIALQNILKFEGLFPSNVESTGYFGSITRDSVFKFQIKYGIVASAASSGAGRVGPITRAKLNELYS